MVKITRKQSVFDKLACSSSIGAESAKKQGRAIGGNYAYGAREGEAQLVARIKDLWTNRKEHGRLSLRQVAERINQEGYRTRKGTSFTRQQVFNIAKT